MLELDSYQDDLQQRRRYTNKSDIGNTTMSTSTERFTENSHDSRFLGHSTAERMSVEDFKIHKVIGRGSFGKVYLVQLKTTGEFFAMKTLKKEIILKQN